MTLYAIRHKETGLWITNKHSDLDFSDKSCCSWVDIDYANKVLCTMKIRLGLLNGTLEIVELEAKGE